MAATVAQCVVRVDDRSAEIIAGRSQLGWLLREFCRFGVTDFLLLTGTARVNAAALMLPVPVRITVVSAPEGGGTGGALFHVREQLQERFLLCDANCLFDWNLARLLAAAAADPSGAIGRYCGSAAGAANGIGLFRRALVDYLQPACSLEADVLPALASRGLLAAAGGLADTGIRRASGGSGDCGSGADVALLRRPAVFLDRDGVLNVDHGYVGSRERFEWVDGAREAIQYATEAGWHVFIVTNQSGVARGLYTEDSVRDLLGWIADEARAAGGTIDDVRYCPFHPEAELEAYRQVHPWRKPLPGMLLDLIQAWELEPRRAIMVGDQDTDLQAAAAAGVAGHWFPGGNLLTFLRPILDEEYRPVGAPGATLTAS